MAQATGNKPTVVHSAFHNTLLNPGSLLIGALLIAIGLAIVPLGALKADSIAQLNAGNFAPLGLVALSGAFVSFGLIVIFTQQYAALALTTALNNLQVVAIATILYAVGQFLVSYGQSLGGTANLYGVIVIIAGYALIGVYLVLTGQAGIALRNSIAPPAPAAS